MLEKIHKNQVLTTKWGKNYIEYINQQNTFKNILKEQKGKPCDTLDNVGVTKEDALSMCLDMDYNSAKAQKHPTTLNNEVYAQKQKLTKSNDNNDDETNS